jgi:hypothetical protein
MASASTCAYSAPGTFSATKLEAAVDFWEVLAELTGGPAVPQDDNTAPPWFEAGVICEIGLETYFEFLELLPPRWMHGSTFAFGEATGLLKLFWRREGRFFGRELTAAETDRFCRLGGVARHW